MPVGDAAAVIDLHTVDLVPGETGPVSTEPDPQARLVGDQQGGASVAPGQGMCNGNDAERDAEKQGDLAFGLAEPPEVSGGKRRCDAGDQAHQTGTPANDHIHAFPPTTALLAGWRSRHRCRRA